ncbi:hypothetical protein PV08_09242 [Exophiala spinifera]|uniref:Cytoplasmic tRNA 2-thiolation protein 2 n=1 Tax=Exophiala spinifera TaxID=91928 RepID=A0A0D2AZ69_9EURO|nr:uncharacterized protein PV08_09242 [Exophiala spinifera]KIW11968.1 hypothetical protein PV08_09242 [Exophiala spinifera]
MIANPCVDCREHEATLTVRNRRLCSACFTYYVQSKILKRMASYGFKSLSSEKERRLFLPLSGGLSSLVLLQVLDVQLQKQIANRNKTSYDIIVARVVLPGEKNSGSIQRDYEALAETFASHTFLPLLSLHQILQLDCDVERDLRHLGIVRHGGESDQDFFIRIVGCSTSASAASDLQSILLKRLLVAAARDQHCDNVLWGHSDTRLAALVLADVAKGRGGSVSSSIADGQTLQGIDFNYPVRDLFKAELQTYARVSSEPALKTTVEQDTQVQQPTSIRNTAIDDLLNTYITSQGEKYPSIMANVVRTASKLEAKRPADNTIVACPVCLLPRVGTQGSLATNSGLCYGCQRMRQDIVP